MKKIKLAEIGEIVGGSTPSTKNSENYDGNIAWITPKDLANYNKIFIESGERSITEKGFNSCSAKILPKNSILFTSRAPIGYVAITKKELCTNQGFKSIIPNDKIYYLFLYYLLKYNKDYIASFGSGTTFKEISGKVMKSIEIVIPDRLEIQKKIAYILFNIDKKIELNNQINDNLLKLLDIYYDKIFTDVICKKRADEIANITIGKTPPRINRDCFSKNNSDIKWLSISDIGKSGVYVFNTAEKLTQNAINTYNVKTIPKNTIVLSFKLTVGRVAITNEEMATNEAIAHFNLYDEKLTSYMYTYLRKYDYNKLGSTSSIATAVNSKIIKTMQIEIPNEKDLEKFNNLADELLRMIRLNEKGNLKLEQLRDTLLPKLMNGEINLDKIEI